MLARYTPTAKTTRAAIRLGNRLKKSTKSCSRILERGCGCSTMAFLSSFVWNYSLDHTASGKLG
jgi:hypothetical protein